MPDIKSLRQKYRKSMRVKTGLDKTPGVNPFATNAELPPEQRQEQTPVNDPIEPVEEAEPVKHPKQTEFESMLNGVVESGDFDNSYSPGVQVITDWAEENLSAEFPEDKSQWSPWGDLANRWFEAVRGYRVTESSAYNIAGGMPVGWAEYGGPDNSLWRLLVNISHTLFRRHNPIQRKKALSKTKTGLDKTPNWSKVKPPPAEQVPVNDPIAEVEPIGIGGGDTPPMFSNFEEVPGPHQEMYGDVDRLTDILGSAAESELGHNPQTYDRRWEGDTDHRGRYQGRFVVESPEYGQEDDPNFAGDTPQMVEDALEELYGLEQHRNYLKDKLEEAYEEADERYTEWVDANWEYFQDEDGEPIEPDVSDVNQSGIYDEVEKLKGQIEEAESWTKNIEEIVRSMMKKFAKVVPVGVDFLLVYELAKDGAEEQLADYLTEYAESRGIQLERDVGVVDVEGRRETTIAREAARDMAHGTGRPGLTELLSILQEFEAAVAKEEVDQGRKSLANPPRKRIKSTDMPEITPVEDDNALPEIEQPIDLTEADLVSPQPDAELLKEMRKLTEAVKDRPGDFHVPTMRALSDGYRPLNFLNIDDFVGALDDGMRNSRMELLADPSRSAEDYKGDYDLAATFINSLTDKVRKSRLGGLDTENIYQAFLTRQPDAVASYVGDYLIEHGVDEGALDRVLSNLDYSISRSEGAEGPELQKWYIRLLAEIQYALNEVRSTDEPIELWPDEKSLRKKSSPTHDDDMPPIELVGDETAMPEVEAISDSDKLPEPETVNLIQQDPIDRLRADYDELVEEGRIAGYPHLSNWVSNPRSILQNMERSREKLHSEPNSWGEDVSNRSDVEGATRKIDEAIARALPLLLEGFPEDFDVGLLLSMADEGGSDPIQDYLLEWVGNHGLEHEWLTGNPETGEQGEVQELAMLLPLEDQLSQRLGMLEDFIEFARTFNAKKSLSRRKSTDKPEPIPPLEPIANDDSMPEPTPITDPNTMPEPEAPHEWEPQVSTQEAMERMVEDDPSDDNLLVYADWLEEQGNPIADFYRSAATDSEKWWDALQDRLNKQGLWGVAPMIGPSYQWGWDSLAKWTDKIRGSNDPFSDDELDLIRRMAYREYYNWGKPKK